MPEKPKGLYTKRIIELNAKADRRKVGVKLGSLCIEQGIPITAVVSRLKISKQTALNWFTGLTSPSGPSEHAVERYIAEIS
jgi:hypothetical protein